MSRTAIVLAALALAASFGVGRATAPEPAAAVTADATLAQVVQQLKWIGKDTRALRTSVDNVEREVRTTCRAIVIALDGSTLQCSG